MRFVAEPISHLRLQRFHRWALLWLTCFAGFHDAAGAFAPLSKHAERIGHLWLDRIERVILAIIMLRAAPRVRALRTKRPFALHRLKQSALSRAVIGASLRRALRPKGLRRRCEALRRISINVLVARILKRVPRGLTRRRPIRTRPDAHRGSAQRVARPRTRRGHVLTRAILRRPADVATNPSRRRWRLPRAHPYKRLKSGRANMVMAALRGWTATQRNVVLAAYLGWTLDAFDFLMLTLITKDIADEFHVHATALGLVITATLALRPIGAFVFGRLADRFGRRPILMINVLLYSALAFASAFSPDYMTFLILRCLFGVAMGGEWGVGSSLAMEHARPDTRGFVSGLLQTGYPTGGLIAAGAAALLLPDYGWRVLVMLSAIPALLVLFIRAGVPESPSWKSGKRETSALQPSTFAAGLAGVALTIFGQFALFTDLLTPFGILPPIAIAAVIGGLVIAATAFGRKHWGLALFAMILMAGLNSLSHGTQDFYSNFLRIQHGFDPRTASLIIMAGSFGAILGGITSGTLSQIIGRRRMITIGVILLLPMIPAWAFLSTTPMAFAFAVFALQFCVQGAWGVVPAHLNEISPGDVRGTFPGFVYQVGNLLSAGVPYGQTYLVENYHWQYGQALALAAVCAAVTIAVLINLGPEGRHVVMSESPSEGTPVK